MVAAATVLCLDSTNVHRQSAANKTFVSLGGSVAVEQKTMALNLGISTAGQLLTTNSSVPADTSENMDTLIVTTNNHIRQISPGTIALQKINEVLARNSPLIPNQQPSSTDENNPSEASSVQTAEQLKEQLMQSIDRNDFTEVDRLIDEIDAAHLSKKALELSRIGAVVNTLRRNISNTYPDLAKKCRALIKSWRSNMEALNCSSRPSSSCGSSGGTPSLVSPAIRRITPGGKMTTPTSQLAYQGYATNASYAPSETVSPQLAVGKRKSSPVSPNSTSGRTSAKKAKVSPTAVPIQPISVIEARRNVQSTEQLVAALGMERFLSSSVSDKKADEAQQTNGKSDPPISIPAINHHFPEKRGGRKKREPIQSSVPPLVIPRLKIKFGGKSSEEHEEIAKIIEKSDTLPEATPSTSSAEISPKKPSSSKKSGKKRKEQHKHAFSWYDKLPTIEELESRSKPVVQSNEPDSPTDPTIWTFKERNIFVAPYLDADEPDFLYPDRGGGFLTSKRSL